MVTVPLSTLNPYVFDFDAEVIHVNEDGSVELDRTYFYATGGGQPSDTGKLLRNEETFIIKDVKKTDGFITHIIDRPGLAQGDKVHCIIDRDRRIMHMRMHTATHILCAVIERAAGAKITGNQIGAEKTRIDMSLDGIDQDKIAEYIAAANGIIAKNLDIKKYVTTREELMKNPHLVKLAMGFPEGIHDVHMVEVPECDNTPCGGTHIANTSEIGRIVFDSAESKGKDRKRIYFHLE
ncbi:TPA: alanyl-tRNA editing protein [Candidatus Woesearchaeota archaeon]|nr:alanyl-tRNA editing protein [Candidatus Woesearchaeota archaeon]